MRGGQTLFFPMGVICKSCRKKEIWVHQVINEMHGEDIIKGSLAFFLKYRNCPPTYRCLLGHLLIMHICIPFRSNHIHWNFPTLYPKCLMIHPSPHSGSSTRFHFPVFPENLFLPHSVHCSYFQKRRYPPHDSDDFLLSLPLSQEPCGALTTVRVVGHIVGTHYMRLTLCTIQTALNSNNF